MNDNGNNNNIENIHEECECCRHKHTPRDEKTLKQLRNRINRIIGQMNGIQKMIDDNRYCGDVLTQIAAAESALQGLGYQILQEHMETCVTEQIKSGNSEVIGETFELIKKLK
jgi:DNA-binding FrmR family transcriptional regulator